MCCRAFIRPVFVTLWALATAGTSNAQTWSPVTATDPGFAGTLVQMTDGQVFVQDGTTNQHWTLLKPNPAGSYIAGTWSATPAPMNLARLYFGSHVLPDGRFWVLGGEYTGSPHWWQLSPTPEKSTIRSQIPGRPLPTTRNRISAMTQRCSSSTAEILAGSIGTRNTYLYDLSTNTWSGAIPKQYDDPSDEETWVKLPGGRVLTYDLFQSIAKNGAYAEVFDPLSNQWSGISPSDGTANGTIPLLSSSALGSELGGIVRLHDGRIFVIGATNHTALYNPETNTWAAGPDINIGSDRYGADDAPVAVLPNGHVLFVADRGPDLGTFKPPSQFFEFDPTANTIVAAANPPTSMNHPAFVTRLLVLPTGQVLYANGGHQLWIYTPSPGIDPVVRPIVNGVVYKGGGIFTLTGRRLNGQSSGSSYGDDVESDENYPIIRLQNSTGTFYARTFNWSTTDVATGSMSETAGFHAAGRLGSRELCIGRQRRGRIGNSPLCEHHGRTGSWPMTAVGSVADMALERTVTTMTYRVLMVACLMLSTLSMPGRTDASPITIYSNFGPGLAHDSAQANPVGFDFFTGDTDAQGASFAAHADAILTSVAVALSGFAGTNAAPVTVALRSDLGGLPDGILETFSIPAASLGPLRRCCKRAVRCDIPASSGPHE